MNHTRTMVKIIKEICQEHHIQFHSFSDDWILELSIPGNNTSGNNASGNRSSSADLLGRTMLVYGNYFPVNGEAIGRICSDKAALSDLLASLEIPHVPHTYFPSPMNEKLTPPAGGIWPAMLSMLAQHGQLVVKNNTGTGGLDVFRVSTPTELEKAVSVIFSHGENVAISPWIDIQNEYRAIIVGKAVALLYRKVRPQLTGDGVHTIQQLLNHYIVDGPYASGINSDSDKLHDPRALSDLERPDNLSAFSDMNTPGNPRAFSDMNAPGNPRAFSDMNTPGNTRTFSDMRTPGKDSLFSPGNSCLAADIASDYIPRAGETIFLTWKHNLGQGAHAEVLYANENIIPPRRHNSGACQSCSPGTAPAVSSLLSLALACAEKLDLQFASIDIVESPSSVQYKILEINSGVMMDNFAAESPENYQMAKSIYKKVIFDYL